MDVQCVYMCWFINAKSFLSFFGNDGNKKPNDTAEVVAIANYYGQQQQPGR